MENSEEIVPSPSTKPASAIPTKRKPDDFRFGKLIGEGSFSSVYLAKDVANGHECAIKVCNKNLILREKKAESIKREKEVMTILSSNRNPKVPFFVKLHATFQDSERLYFVMTYARGGELLKYISKRKTDSSGEFFDLTCSRFYIGEIIVALSHLHSLNIIHRDLKPENILLDERGHILVTDFGSAKILNVKKVEVETDGQDQNQPSNNSNAQAYEPSASPEPVPRRPKRHNSFVGTAQYVSPEILQGNYSSVSEPVDLWALGCIIYQCTYGVTPFSAPNEYLIFQKILKLGYEFPEDVECNPSTRDLIENLLILDPSQRLGAQDTQRYISLQSHPFFNGEDIEKYYEQNPTPLFKYLTSKDEVGSGESADAKTYKVPDIIAPGFNPRTMAERALQDDDVGIPFSTTKVHPDTPDSGPSKPHSNNSVPPSKSLEQNKPDILILKGKEDELMNNTKNNNDNTNDGCGCNCTLF